MGSQVVYVANFDYNATYANIRRSGVAVVDLTEKGLIWMRFKGTRTVFLLSPNGRIQVKWSSLEEKKVLLKILRNMLVPVEGQKLTIKPLKQQVFIDYPTPQNFKLYWCEAETEYVKKADFDPSLILSVSRALEDLRRELYFLREPTVQEVAARAARTPEDVRPILYMLANETGWREQEREEAEGEAEAAINLAGWIAYLKKGEQNPELNKMAQEAIERSPPNIVERAKKILENFPQLAPEAKPSFKGKDISITAGLNEWSWETKKAWMKAFSKEPPDSARGNRISITTGPGIFR